MPGHGSDPPPPPKRTGTLASVYRRATGKAEKEPEVARQEVFIATYELEWEKLKNWLDVHFADYGRTFTESYEIVCEHQCGRTHNVLTL